MGMVEDQCPTEVTWWPSLRRPAMERGLIAVMKPRCTDWFPPSLSSLELDLFVFFFENNGVCQCWTWNISNTGDSSNLPKYSRGKSGSVCSKCLSCCSGLWTEDFNTENYHNNVPIWDYRKVQPKPVPNPGTLPKLARQEPRRVYASPDSACNAGEAKRCWFSIAITHHWLFLLHNLEPEALHLQTLSTK